MPLPIPSSPVADARSDNFVDRFFPDALKPYARLARWDRPFGIWLLFWPCAFGFLLANANATAIDWRILPLMLLGAVAMRGAGCTFNDLVDADLDARVARTQSRPLPAGQVTRRQAALFLVAQALAGLGVLVQFNALTIGLGAASLVLIAVYPFMKRVTWWPQAFLALVFSWGALLGWTAVRGGLAFEPIALYLGCMCWVIGYDTIYALQDRDDDALVGIKSTARLFGARVKPPLAGFYLAAVLCWLAAGARLGPVFAFGILGVGLHFAWQVATLEPNVPASALARLKSNNGLGLGLSIALLVAAIHFR